MRNEILDLKKRSINFKWKKLTDSKIYILRIKNIYKN